MQIQLDARTVTEIIAIVGSGMVAVLVLAMRNRGKAAGRSSPFPFRRKGRGGAAPTGCGKRRKEHLNGGQR